jgi:dethiobiotin synthetase
VTSGKHLSDTEVDAMCEAVRETKEKVGISVCGSFGLLNEQQFRRLKEAGVTRVHNNLEISNRNYNKTDMALLKELGYEVRFAMSKNLFITGTGTDVGKTYVTGLIVKKLREGGASSAYYKAAMSGNERRPDSTLIPGDALQVKTMSGVEQPLEEMCPYIYETAVSPHLAAKIEGNPIEMECVLKNFDRVCGTYDYVTVEGSGGIFCPLRFDEQKIQLEDFIKARSLACLMIADAGLGTINAVVLTAEYMKARKIPVKGIIFNHYEPGNPLHEDNRLMCEAMTGLNVVACVKDGDMDLDIPFELMEGFYEENGGNRK